MNFQTAKSQRTHTGSGQWITEERSQGVCCWPLRALCRSKVELVQFLNLTCKKEANWPSSPSSTSVPPPEMGLEVQAVSEELKH